MIFTFPLRVCSTTDIKFHLDLIPPLIFCSWLADHLHFIKGGYFFYA